MYFHTAHVEPLEMTNGLVSSWVADHEQRWFCLAVNPVAKWLLLHLNHVDDDQDKEEDGKEKQYDLDGSSPLSLASCLARK